MSVDTVAFTSDATGPEAPEQPQEQQERPEGLPEKFNSVEDMAQSYHELEQKMGEGSSEESTEESTQQEATDQVVESIGADAFEKYSAEYFENENKLSEDSYKELQEKYNFSPELVDSYIRGQEAVAQSELNEVHEVVGGADKYNEVVTWAQDNLKESEIDHYNEVVLNGNNAAIKLALQGMYARYASENGIDPTLVQGGGKARAAGYESRQQMIDDMKRPEYKDDPAFREQVERRLANTPASVI
jgi:hypothetical protein